jgi:glycosyltransferase involved in cell wall biosynthesis
MASRAHSLEVDRVVSHESVRVVFPPDKAKLYWKLIGARRTLRENQIDLYHGLAHQIPRSVRLSAVPKVVTIHDLIYLHHPEFSPEDDLDRYDRQLRAACSISDRIIAVSESTKRDLIRFFSISPEKIRVIYSPCDARFGEKVSKERKIQVRKNYKLPDKYLLYVGSMAARKNLLAVVKAIREIPSENRIPLVIIGNKTAYSKTVFEYAEQAGLQHYLVTPKYVATDDLPAVYQGAQLFLYVSHYEGFGMPILEAITSGTPVVTSRTSAMPEAGGPGAALVDPENPLEIASKISELLVDDARENAVREGLIHAMKFDNSRIARKLVSLYQDVSDSKGFNSVKGC